MSLRGNWLRRRSGKPRRRNLEIFLLLLKRNSSIELHSQADEARNLLSRRSSSSSSAARRSTQIFPVITSAIRFWLPHAVTCSSSGPHCSIQPSHKICIISASFIRKICPESPLKRLERGASPPQCFSNSRGSAAKKSRKKEARRSRLDLDITTCTKD